jgi:hypothetical protein
VTCILIASRNRANKHPSRDQALLAPLASVDRGQRNALQPFHSTNESGSSWRKSTLSPRVVGHQWGLTAAILAEHARKGGQSMFDRSVTTRIVLSCTLAVGLWAGSAQAAPVHPELGAVTTAAAEPLVQKVHGFHRSCRYSAVTGWHRHLPSGRLVSCGPYYYDDDYYDFPGIYFYFGDGHRRYHHYRGHRPDYRGHPPYRHR